MDIETALNTLKNLLTILVFSTDDEERSASENELHRMEPQDSYCLLLFKISQDKSLRADVRLMAIIQMKLAISRNWHKIRMPNRYSIGPSEKAELKTLLLESLEEENGAIAIQKAAVIATIARVEWPINWENLFQILAQCLQSSRNLVVLRASEIFHLVLKELSQKVIENTRRHLQQVAPDLFQILSQEWKKFTFRALEAISKFSHKEIAGNELEQLYPLFEPCKFYVRDMTRLVQYGMPSFYQNQDVMNFLEHIASHLPIFVACEQSVPDNPLADTISQLIYQQVKMIFKVQQTHPIGFAPALGPFLKLFHDQLCSFALSEKTNIIMMRFLKNAYARNFEMSNASAKYNPNQNQNQNADQQKEDLKNLCLQTVSAFFTRDCVLSLCQLIICRIFPITPTELESWKDDPEEFWRLDDHSNSFLNQKICAEDFFLQILKQEEGIGESIVHILISSLKENGGESYPHIIARDACYLALGACPYQLYDYIDFESWLMNDLLRDLQLTCENNFIVQKRILWLIGGWAEKISSPSARKLAYSILSQFLQHKNIALGLTASASLTLLVYDSQFSEEEFLQDNICQQALFGYFNMLQNTTVKTNTMAGVTALINRVGQPIVPFSGMICKTFQQLWESGTKSSEEGFLRESIIDALGKLAPLILAGETRDFDAILFELTLPIIDFSTDRTNPESIYLIEHALSLWLTLLTNVSTSLAKINLPLNALELFGKANTLLHSTFDYCKICMRILEEYALLFRQDFLQKFANELSSIFKYCGENLKDQSLIWTLKTLEVLIQIFPTSLEVFSPALFLLFERLRTRHEEEDDEEDIEPSFSRQFLSKHTETSNILTYSIFARVLLHNPQFFFNFFQAILQQQTSNNNSSSNQNVFIDFLEEWFERMDAMTPLQRKLSTLAFINFFVMENQLAITYASSIVGMCISTSANRISADESTFKDEFDSDDSSDVNIDEVPESSSAKEDLFNNDPVIAATVMDYLRQTLQTLAEKNPEFYKQCLSSVPPNLIQLL